MITEWLTKHKVYFEIIAYTVLPIAAIIVTVNANHIASQQSDIAKEQATIMRQEQLPILTLDVKLTYDETLSKYTEDHLIISNEGTALRNLQIDSAVFFLIEYGGKNQPLQYGLVPISDYYYATALTDNPTGLLADLYTPDNNLTANSGENQFASYAEQNNAYGSLEVRRYVKITYDDIFGDSHTEFYYVDPVSGGVLLTPGLQLAGAEEAIKLHDNLLTTNLFFELGNISPEVILNKLNGFLLIKNDYPLLHFLWE